MIDEDEDSDKVKEEKRNSIVWHRKRVLDCDGTYFFLHSSPSSSNSHTHTGELAEGLERQMRDGDIRREGVIWPHVAEISLSEDSDVARNLSISCLESSRNQTRCTSML